MDLREMLGIKYPVIQGGMANIATGEFAASVSEAGGLGLIATGGFTLDEIRQEIRKAKKLTQKPFGVNIMLMLPYADDIADMVVEEGVKIITTGAGNPGKYVEKWKEAGIKVFPVVPSVGLARRMEQSGVDGLIAEGTESGGHVGELTTMALIPQVVDAVSIPVIAAGGIADGRGIAAVYALGASGVQLGTLLLASEECPVHENYKQAVLKAKDTDTVVTGRSGGAPVRVLKNKMTREYLKKENAEVTREELEMLTLGALRRAVFEGDMKTGSVMLGQIAGMVRDIRPMKEILDELWQDYERVMKELCAKAEF